VPASGPGDQASPVAVFPSVSVYSIGCLLLGDGVV
jgi:hypothetical protein